MTDTPPPASGWSADYEPHACPYDGCQYHCWRHQHSDGGAWMVVRMSEVGSCPQMGPLLAEALAAGIWFRMGGEGNREVMASGVIRDDNLRQRLKRHRHQIAKMLGYQPRPCEYHWGSPGHPCVRCAMSYRDHVKAWGERHSTGNVLPFPVVIE